MRSPLRPSTIAAAHRRTAARYWELAEIAEKTGHIARAREFVALALKFDRRATAAVGRLSDDLSGSGSLRQPLKAARTPLVRPVADIEKNL